MRNRIGRDYLSNPRQFDGWLKANAVFSLVLAIGMLAMAVAGLYSGGPVDVANVAAEDLSSVTLPK
jgi:hypothetical protein